MGFLSGFSAVGFAGSRSRVSPDGAYDLVSRVVSSALVAGLPLSVGCCCGFDAAVISSWIARAPCPRSPLAVFAAFGPLGAGTLNSSSVFVERAACWPGASVSWWSGGGPDVAPRDRLRARSSALVASLPASAAFVCFFGPGVPRGSRRSSRLAAARGLAVFGFAVGRSSPLPVLVPGGRWVAVAGPGVWSSAFRWVSPPSLI